SRALLSEDVPKVNIGNELTQFVEHGVTDGRLHALTHRLISVFEIFANIVIADLLEAHVAEGAVAQKRSGLEQCLAAIGENVQRVAKELFGLSAQVGESPTLFQHSRNAGNFDKLTLLVDLVQRIEANSPLRIGRPDDDDAGAEISTRALFL